MSFNIVLSCKSLWGEGKGKVFSLFTEKYSNGRGIPIYQAQWPVQYIDRMYNIKSEGLWRASFSNQVIQQRNMNNISGLVISSALGSISYSYFPLPFPVHTAGCYLQHHSQFKCTSPLFYSQRLYQMIMMMAHSLFCSACILWAYHTPGNVWVPVIGQGLLPHGH